MAHAPLEWDIDEEKSAKFIDNLAPIVLFTYNRLDHTKQTLEALQKNVYAGYSDLYIYSDASKSELEVSSVNDVREYLKTVKGFKTVNIIKREVNWGLAKNIIDGVTDLVNKYGKIIVLEDDIVTSKYFLKYMNDALEVYKNKKRVMQITGYMYPIKTYDLPETFFVPITSSWGWATWADRWAFFEKDTGKIIKEFSKKTIESFNLQNSYDFWQQILDNESGEIDTWAVFWYASVFNNDGIVLYTKYNLAKNIGFDGSGINCGVDKNIKDTSLYEKPIWDFNILFKSDNVVLSRCKDFFAKKYSSNFLAKIKKNLRGLIR